MPSGEPRSGELTRGRSEPGYLVKLGMTPLTDPGSHGGDPDDAFDVVIPSLPGFAFSGLPPAGPVTPPVIADLWARLTSDVLGYPRFGAYGGDIGSHVTGFLGARHRDRVLGIYTHHPNLHPVLDGAPVACPGVAGAGGRLRGAGRMDGRRVGA